MATVPARASRFSFPNPVNEVAARLVAAGVVVMAVAVVLGQTWILLPLAYGFVARVAAGPRYSPLGLLVTRVAVPRLGAAPRNVPGPPKRFAQGMGAVITVAALVLEFGFDQTGAARLLAAADRRRRHARVGVRAVHRLQDLRAADAARRGAGADLPRVRGPVRAPRVDSRA